MNSENSLEVLHIFCLVLVSILISGCGLTRNVPHDLGGKQEVIQNSITDFNKTQLFDNGELFSVSFDEHFVDYKLVKKNENESGWTADQSYPSIYAVSILNHKTKFFYNPSDTGKFKTNVPQCTLWKDGKLFYWWDDEKPLTESTINTFRELGLIETNPLLLEFGSDDSQKAAHYFVCKSDISKYKRKITNIAIGYYTPPRISCK